MLELGQKAQWFQWYDTKNARKYGLKKWTELIFWPNWAMFCPLRLKTFYTFPTKSIFTCASLLEFIFLVFLYCIFELIRDFDLIPRLIAKLQYQLSSGSLFVEDYTQQNWWDYAQQNCDWKTPKLTLCTQKLEKTTMTEWDQMGSAENNPGTNIFNNI